LMNQDPKGGGKTEQREEGVVNGVNTAGGRKRRKGPRAGASDAHYKGEEKKRCRLKLAATIEKKAAVRKEYEGGD